MFDMERNCNLLPAGEVLWHMNALFFPRAALLALALATASATAGFAQSTTSNPASAPATPPDDSTGKKHHHHHHLSSLTPSERAELKQARKAAFAADPSLKTQHDELKARHRAMKTAAPGDKASLHAEKKAYHQQLRAAELKADPNLAPIFAKLDAAHKGHHHHSST